MFLGQMSSKDWIITVASAPVIGLAEDSNIELEMADDKNTVTSGIGGDWSFVENPSEVGTLKFTTQRTSLSNAVLFGAYSSKRVFSASLTNIRNGSTHSLPFAMIQKKPTDGVPDGTNAQTLDWVVITGEVKSVII